MNGQQIVAIYETVACLNEQMLAAARSSDWDRLIELEAACHPHVQALKDNEPAGTLADEARTRTAELIRCILARDHEIRALSQARTTQLASLLGNASSQRKLNATYGVTE